MFKYERMVENALRGVLREALNLTLLHGLPGEHHFFITFRTAHPGVDIAPRLRARHPDEMTIVLQHQFWGLEVTEEGFAVTLSFNRLNERLVIPFAAVTAFADPSAKFGLQFQVDLPEAEAEAVAQDTTPVTALQTPVPAPLLAAAAPSADAEAPPSGNGQVIALDAFRKK